MARQRRRLRRIGRPSRLGNRTLVIIRQEPAGRANTMRDGERITIEGADLQLRPQRTLESYEREQRTEQIWDLFAPAGTHIRHQDQIMVIPGPVDADGVTPARLNMIGPSDPQFDGEGNVDHVLGQVRRRVG